MQCEMCGKDVEEFYRTRIEGTILNVCKSCAAHGEVLKEIRPEPKKDIKKQVVENPSKPEIIEELVEGYAEKIKNKRERLDLKQEELAKKINEKESIIQKIESGHFAPSVELARKLERFLGIKLIEEVEEGKLIVSPKPSSSDEFTLGDFVKVRKK